MIAVPRDVRPGAEQVTGLVCPDCHGVLQIRRDGSRGQVTFVCRIGHGYGLQDLLTAKEEDLERRAWAAVLGASEMHALLEDLIAGGFVSEETAARFRARGESAQRLMQGFRAAIAADRSLRLETDEGADAPGHAREPS